MIYAAVVDLSAAGSAWQCLAVPGSHPDAACLQ